jgi:hypothetical protein
MHVIYRSVFEYFDSYALLLDVLVPVFSKMECSNCLSNGEQKYLAGNGGQDLLWEKGYK